MDNSAIHTGFHNKEIRDFISLSFVKNLETECKSKKEKIPYDRNNPYLWTIRDAEEDIKQSKIRIELAKEKMALYKMMEMMGWDIYDVSDHTEKDTDYIAYMSFIGTEIEYDAFLENIVNNKQ